MNDGCQMTTRFPFVTYVTFVVQYWLQMTIPLSFCHLCHFFPLLVS
jgi:hypothetical protein